MMNYSSGMIESATLVSFRLGDTKAFETIYNAYHKRIGAFCVYHGQHPEDAQEVVQDVFIKLWTIRESIDPDRNFEAFIFKIAKNIIFDKFRKLVRQRAAQEYQIYTLIPENDTENRVLYNDLQERIMETLESLPKIRRMVFHMSRIRQFSNKEIATEMGISIRTVENHISKALTAFNERFGDSRAISILYFILFQEVV